MERLRMSAPSSKSPPASRTRSATAPRSSMLQCPSTRACPLPERIAPVSARSPSSSPSRRDDHGLAGAGLTREGREAGAEGQACLADDPEVTDGDLFDHEVAGPPSSLCPSSSGPRHPVVGSANLLTSRSVKGPECRRARRTGVDERRAMTRAPVGSSKARRPSPPTARRCPAYGRARRPRARSRAPRRWAARRARARSAARAAWRRGSATRSGRRPRTRRRWNPSGST